MKRGSYTEEEKLNCTKWRKPGGIQIAGHVGELPEWRLGMSEA